MVGSAGWFGLPAPADLIARAELIGAQKRPASNDALDDTWFLRIEAGGGTLRIRGDVARRGERLVVIGAVPIGRPFPDIARHVVQAVAVRRIRRNGHRIGMTVRRGAL